MDNMLRIIFPEGAPDHVNEKQNPELLDYLQRLGTHKIEQLRKEDARLSEDIKAAVENTQDLAITNYKAFILTSECSREIFREFKETEQKLDKLVDHMPGFSDVCQKFINKSQEINAERRINTITLKKNDQLLEILELPQLMDACIKSGRYEDALELAAHVQRMGQKHENIAIIKEIVKSIEGSWHTMLMQLLSQLKTDLQLPKCLQVFGYLRRMQAFSNTDLKLKFLQARDAWLNGLLAAIPASDPQQHLTKTIEVTRVNVFNIITQYKAIFGEEDFGSSSSGHQQRPTSNAGDEKKLLSSWLSRKVEQFLKTLDTDLNRGISSLDTVLGQCMYFGMSFSRIGADFRSQMAPIFLRVISKRVEEGVKAATKDFQLEMENYTLINRVSSRKEAIGYSDDTDSVSPPETMMDFRPLANYCNSILNLLNDLRLCAPMAMATHLARALECSLQAVATVIGSFFKQEQQAFAATEKENFLRFCSSFVYDLIPYLQKCVHVLFPVQTLADHLGVPVMSLQKSGVSYLNQSAIVKGIDHLLPVKEAIVPIAKVDKEEEENIEEVVNEVTTEEDRGENDERKEVE